MTNEDVSAKKLAAFLAENQPAQNEDLQPAVLQRVHLGFFAPSKKMREVADAAFSNVSPGNATAALPGQ